jgi:opacity protein-like surface antigen
MGGYNMKRDRKDTNSLFMLKVLFIAFTIIISVIFLGSIAYSQTGEFRSIKGVVFKDGSVLRGQILEMNASVVKIQTSDGSVLVRKYDDVKSFIKDEGDFIKDEGVAIKDERMAPSGSYSMETSKANYVVLKAGIYSPQSDDLRDFGTGFNGEIAFGHYFNRFLAMEIGVGYFRTTASWSAAVSGPGVTAGATADATINVIPITLSVKPTYRVQNLEMYALAGVGLYIAEAKVSGTASATIGNRSFSASGSASDTDTVFGPHLGAGISFDITPAVFLGLEGKYFWAKPEWEAYGVKVDAHIDGFLFTGNLGLRF